MVKKTSKSTRTKTAAKTSNVAKKTSRVETDNAPVVRRELFNMETLNILLSAIILVVLLYSLSLGTTIPGDTIKASSTTSAYTSDPDACKIFCTNNPQYGDSKFAGVAENGHCLCEMTLDSVPIYAQNKTMSATLMIDQGIIIKEATLSDGIEEQPTVPFMQ